MELFTPRRPLRPPRKERKKLKTQNLKTNFANIVIVRAFNVPVRDETLEVVSNQQQKALFPHTVPNEGRDGSEGHTFTTVS